LARTSVTSKFCSSTLAASMPWPARNFTTAPRDSSNFCCARARLSSVEVKRMGHKAMSARTSRSDTPLTDT
jgi:hypothetical protein